MLHNIRKELIELNHQYIENELVITKLQLQLQRHIKNAFTSTDLSYSIQFCEDWVTLFRFLLETNYDYDKAYEKLIDNIEWRLEEKVDQLTWYDFQDWLQHGFVSYHPRHDCFDQPITILRLRYFPLTIYQQDKLSFGEKIKSFACFMMETARKWTWYETIKKMKVKKQEKNKDKNTFFYLTLQLNVIVDMTNTPFLPMDKSMLTLLSHTMESRYPYFVGKIYVLNFSFMYQALWQILKFILSDETKNKIIFTTQQHLLQIIPKENLLKEFGGSDDYEWVMETNEILQKYGIQISDVLSPILKPELCLSHPNQDNDYPHDYTDLDLNNKNSIDNDQDTMQLSYGVDSTSLVYPNVLHYFGFNTRCQVGLYTGYSGFLSTTIPSNSCLTTPLITAKKKNIMDTDIDVDMLLLGDDDDQFSLNSSIFTTHSNETITDGSTLIGNSGILTEDDNNSNNNKDMSAAFTTTTTTTMHDIFLNNDEIVLKKKSTSISSSSIIMNHQSIQTDPIFIPNYHGNNHQSFILNKSWLMFRKALFYMIIYIILRIPIESFFYLQLTSYIDPHQHLISTIGATALFVFFMAPLLSFNSNITY
ncbi:unnamed protein product [Cunninghamella echinulata]